MGYPYQTSIQNIDAVRFGSAKMEVTATIGSTYPAWTTGASTGGSTYINLGIVRGLTVKEEVTRAWVGGDNVDPRPLVVKQRMIISGTLVEYDPLAWNTMRGGIDVYAASTGDSGHKEVDIGGIHIQDPFQVQATNQTVTTSAVGDTTWDMRINVWKCYDNGSLEFAFQPDEDEGPMEMPIEFLVVPDTTRNIADGLLYQILDEQSTS